MATPKKEKENKKSTENLVSLADRTTEEQREIAQKGGIASGEARKEKKLLKESILALLELKDDTGLTNQEKLIKALFEKACKGDVQAFNSLRDTAGQKPVDKIEQTNIDTTPFEIKIVE